MPAITIVGGAAPVTVEALPGDSLFDAGAKASAGIDTACVGKGTCGLCRV
jgi:ferredoxin